MPIAIDRAIREIISPVVERSVTISCVTTRELMLKDFAMEPDEQRMRKAAQLMVQNLAGSLALVTCKEPLRVACGNHMRSLMQQAAIDPQLLEQVTQVCSSDNLELGCTLIEKAATEKAVRDIEEALAPAFAIRRKHREQTGLPYYDMSIFTSGRYPASLPEALRPKPGGLQPAQRRVYEDFNRIPRVTAALEALVDEGLVKAIGLSNFSIAMIESILKVAKGASPRAIKKGYHARAKQWHPDKNRGVGEEKRLEKAERNFKLIAKIGRASCRERV